MATVNSSEYSRGHDEKDPDDPATPNEAALQGWVAFVEPLIAGKPVIQTCGVSTHADFKNVSPHELAQRLIARGIATPLVLAERALSGVDAAAEARSLGLNVEQSLALHAAAVAALSNEDRAAIEAELKHPRGKGLLPPDHPEIAKILRGIGIEKRHVTRDALAKWKLREAPWLFLPRGPIRAVDHRPKLGPARDQGGRPTCTSFGSTAVAEALEFLRDRRPQPRDFSEEFLWWYSKNGALITAGGYDGRVALYHYEQNGVPLERLLPYSGQQINSNHAHVPVADDAIDAAGNNKQPPLALLPERDIGAVKIALESGRCVTFGSDTYDWNTATGVICFPDPLDLRGVGGGHCTTIIGYIDRDDLPAHFEGGYFIVRNSWGGAESTTHLMGPEYGGHLLMPYGWYRRYTGWPGTLATLANPTGATSQWRAEWYDNPSLRGLPAKVTTVNDVHFDWGSGGPFSITISLPIVGNIVIPVPPFDRFSARFSQVRRLRPGWYRFTLRGDDGVRLWVDDRIVINAWKDQPRTSHSAEHYLSGGDHVLRIEYYEAQGLANIEFAVEAIPFHYELFANTDLTGAPAATFDDSLTDPEWRHAPPVGNFFTRGRFSLRTTGQKRFDAGRYRFHARHTGGCRIYLDNALVLDDWTGTDGSGAPVNVSAGLHEVKVEFAHRATLPGPTDRAYYRAAVAFDWTTEAWHGRVHFDPAREQIANAGWPNPDSIYEAFRTQALTGTPAIEHDYVLPAPAGTAYFASDAAETYIIAFPTSASFGTGIAPTVINDTSSYFSAILTRRIHVATTGRYQVTLSSDEAFRVVVDGNKVLERRYGGSDPFGAEIFLAAGVHDVSIEYADSGWGAQLIFMLRPAWWTVSYFTGTELATIHSSKQVMGVERVVADRPTTLGAANWSARATRSIWLPVGRFRLAARSDDGVRVKANGKVLIDAWRNQAPTTYTEYLEHSGGQVQFEIEYYQAGGGAELSFEVIPDGFLGEYYRGTQLDKPADPGLWDWARNPPWAYRFEPSVDFDWGASGRLPRVGADRFSARWWGSVELPVGRWRFRLTSDDGVRLFLDDRLLIDRWVDQAATAVEAVVDIAGGRRELRVEYYEKTGSARCQLQVLRSY